MVSVFPLDWEKISATPAYPKIFFVGGAPTIPVPLGAGMNRSLTEPHFPVILVGMVCGLPILFPQYPLLMN